MDVPLLKLLTYTAYIFWLWRTLQMSCHSSRKGGQLHRTCITVQAFEQLLFLIPCRWWLQNLWSGILLQAPNWSTAERLALTSHTSTVYCGHVDKILSFAVTVYHRLCIPVYEHHRSYIPVYEHRVGCQLHEPALPHISNWFSIENWPIHAYLHCFVCPGA